LRAQLEPARTTYANRFDAAIIPRCTDYEFSAVCEGAHAGGVADP
jgi:hypothetical protein